MTAKGDRLQASYFQGEKRLLQNYDQKKLQRGDRWIDKMLLLFKSGKIFGCPFQNEATFKFFVDSIRIVTEDTGFCKKIIIVLSVTHILR